VACVSRARVRPQGRLARLIAASPRPGASRAAHPVLSQPISRCGRSSFSTARRHRGRNEVCPQALGGRHSLRPHGPRAEAGRRRATAMLQRRPAIRHGRGSRSPGRGGARMFVIRSGEVATNPREECGAARRLGPRSRPLHRRAPTALGPSGASGRHRGVGRRSQLRPAGAAPPPPRRGSRAGRARLGSSGAASSCSRRRAAAWAPRAVPTTATPCGTEASSRGTGIAPLARPDYRRNRDGAARPPPRGSAPAPDLARPNGAVLAKPSEARSSRGASGTLGRPTPRGCRTSPASVRGRWAWRPRGAPPPRGSPCSSSTAVASADRRAPLRGSRTISARARVSPTGRSSRGRSARPRGSGPRSRSRTKGVVWNAIPRRATHAFDSALRTRSR